MRRVKYIFVVGGVMSGVGKGIASASIAKILQWSGSRVTCVKIDPYINVDAGTMNPIEHGEVFVLKDGTECDQDMGHYERFLAKDLSGANYMTLGSVYLSLIQKERRLEFGGKCVEVVPHFPLEVIEKIDRAAKESNAEIVIVEIGGTIGEYQNALFLEAVRILKLRNPDDALLVLVGYLPYQGHGAELKTKPTQHAVRTINASGLQPDIILARARFPLDEKRKEKIAFNCNLHPDDIVSAPNVEHVYDVPLNFEKDRLGEIIRKKLKIRSRPLRNGKALWKSAMQRIKKAHHKKIRVGIVGKYFTTGDFTLSDAYISVIEAIHHAAYRTGCNAEILWLNAEEYDARKIGRRAAARNLATLRQYGGIIVPGGFGSRGVEGKIAAVSFCRKNKIPYFGLCYGMQLMIAEFARSVCGMKDANTTEVNPRTKHPVIDILDSQKGNLRERRYGGTMRLGAHDAVLVPGTLAHGAYRSRLISERHRHRYEVNPKYVRDLEAKGLVFSGRSPDGVLMEIAELPKSRHPFFLGTQFHPELQSRFLSPHPLYLAFIKAAMRQ